MRGWGDEGIRLVDLGRLSSNIGATMAKTPPREVLGRLAAARPLEELAEHLRAQGVAQGSGLWGSSVAAVATILRQLIFIPMLLV
jgi:hypothetical protein